MILLKQIMPRELFWRSLLIVVIPVVLLQGVVAYIFFERHWDTVSRHLALGIAGDVAYIMRAMHAFPEPAYHDWMLRSARQEMQIDAVFEEGAKLPAEAPERSNRIMDRVLYDALDQRIYYPFHIDTRRSDKLISIRIQLPDGVLSIYAPLKRISSSTTYVFVLWMVGTAVVVTGLAVVFLRNQVRPIRRLAEAADAFGKGRSVDDFKPSGAREVRQAAAAFLEMRQRIARAITQRTEMLAGVSHDLRTPLTRMKLQLALLRESNSGAGEEIGDLESDLAAMEKMIDEYLAFAKGQGSEDPIPADLSDILREVTDGVRRNGRDIVLDSEQPLVLPIRPGAIRRCLTNLVDNAAHYGKHVEVHARRAGQVVEVAVEDDGPGIPPDMSEEVFKPFIRLDGARNPNSGGTGLGLAIARDVARGHGGDIRLTKAALGGLRAVLWLPV